MINNRQGGRRRGRGGQRPQGMPGNSGNARDNRQRGNAAQLLEKYKSMARDAQLAGDRVQTEYYLQFADHYFRMLEESRSRFEEQNPRRGRGRDDEDDDDGDDMMVDGDQDDGDEGDDDIRQQPRRDYQRDRNQDRGERQDRPDRQDRPQRQDRGERQERTERPDRGERVERPRAERPRRERPVADNEGGDEQRIPLNVLPPSIPVSQDDEEPAPAPRRRSRKPRDEGNSEDMAPAA